MADDASKKRFSFFKAKPKAPGADQKRSSFSAPLTPPPPPPPPPPAAAAGLQQPTPVAATSSTIAAGADRLPSALVAGGSVGQLEAEVSTLRAQLSAAQAAVQAAQGAASAAQAATTAAQALAATGGGGGGGTAAAPAAAGGRGNKSDLEYSDNDLETQLRTAMNETESLRIQRDSLREDLKALTREVMRSCETGNCARPNPLRLCFRPLCFTIRPHLLACLKKVDDLREQLASSMSDTKKALKTQLTAARDEAADLKRQLEKALASDGGGGGGGGGGAAPALVQAAQPADTVGILKVATKKKKGMRFAADMEEVRQFTRDADGGITLVPDPEPGAPPPAPTPPLPPPPAETVIAEALARKELMRKLSGSWESRAANLTLICDLDGTLLPAPKKVNKKKRCGITRAGEHLARSPDAPKIL